MRSIRTIFQPGSLKRLEPLDLAENTELTVALLETDDLSPQALECLRHGYRPQ
jgi:hypothetical protein